MSKDDQRGAEVVWPTCVDETRVAVVMRLSERRRFVRNHRCGSAVYTKFTTIVLH
jgi:hypothetical protein